MTGGIKYGQSEIIQIMMMIIIIMTIIVTVVGTLLTLANSNFVVTAQRQTTQQAEYHNTGAPSLAAQTSDLISTI
jgi:flagellar basal body-associated protein FliL